MNMETRNEAGNQSFFSSTFAWRVIVAVSVLYLVLAMHTPISVLGDASHDDGLFIGHALSVLSGNWFGAYDQLTLAKGPGYTFFLVLGYVSGLPITLMHALLYMLAVLCVVLAVARLTEVTWLPVLLYPLLLMHPAAQPLRVIRDWIHAPQVLLLCGALLFLMMDCRRGRFRPWLAAGAGVLLGWFWLTREEGLWLVPGLALLVFGTGWLHRQSVGSTRALIKTLIVFLVVAVGVNVAYSAINKMRYGKFIAVDFKDANFVSALAALQGVHAGETIPYVPVPQKVRVKIYAASPSFSELKEYFDNTASPDSGWGSVGCRVYPGTCGDIAGGWFVWALRDAVASRGYYRSPGAASMFYERLANEIHDACHSGRLTCSTSVVPFMPQITSGQLYAIPETLVQAIELLAFIKNPPRLDRIPSSTNAQIDALLGRPLRTPQKGAGDAMFRLTGWYHAKGAGWFDVRCEGGGDANVTIRRMLSQDVAKALGDPNAGRQRFEMIVKSDPACPLEIDGVGKHAFNVSDVLAGRKAFVYGDETLYIDSHEAIGSPSPVDTAADLIRDVRRWLISAYSVLLPLIGGIGLAAYLGQFVLALTRRVQVTLPFVVATSLWVIIAARVAVVALVDISAFPAINQRYLMPAYPLFCLASLLSMFGLLVSVRNASMPPRPVG